jgi:hypothetical protein
MKPMGLWLLLLGLLIDTPTRVEVQFFVMSDCPVSNGYAPEIQKICDAYRTKGVGCSLVYEDLRITPAGVTRHLAEYGYRGITSTIDTNHRLAAQSKASVTPEAVLIDSTGAVRYRGRIDNKYIALGRPRRVVTSHDLRNALDAVLAGRPVPAGETPAIGCFIPTR